MNIHEPYDLLCCIQEDCAESIAPVYTIGQSARYSTERIGNTVFVQDHATGMFFKVTADREIENEWNRLGGTNSPQRRPGSPKES